VAGGFDEVIVATGAVPRVPDISGQSHPKVLSYGMTPEERKVVFGASLGTVFEWYNFLMFGSL